MESPSLWYARRDGVIRGPFSRAQVSQYLLLGRIRLGDELRNGGEPWRLAEEWPDVVPQELTMIPTEENQERLMKARIAADERSGVDRRSLAEVSDEIRDRRSGAERRQPEPDAVVTARRVRTGIEQLKPDADRRRHHRWVVAGAIVVGVLLYLWAGSPLGWP